MLFKSDHSGSYVEDTQDQWKENHYGAPADTQVFAVEKGNAVPSHIKRHYTQSKNKSVPWPVALTQSIFFLEHVTGPKVTD